MFKHAVCIYRRSHAREQTSTRVRLKSSVCNFLSPEMRYPAYARPADQSRLVAVDGLHRVLRLGLEFRSSVLSLGLKPLNPLVEHRGKVLSCAFRLTAEGGPSAPPPLATAMYAREHGLLSHFLWSGRDSGGVRGVARAQGCPNNCCRELVLVIILTCGCVFTV